MINLVPQRSMALGRDAFQRRRGPVLLAVLGLTLAPAMARAQGTAEQQQACTPDALRLCSAEIPDIPKTTACMKAHLGQLSARCRAAFNDAVPKGAEPATKTAGSKAAEPKSARTPAKTRMAAREEHKHPRSVVASRQTDRYMERRDMERRDMMERRDTARRAPRTARVHEETAIIERPVAVVRPPVAVAAEPVAAAPGFLSTRTTVAAMCRQGLIDAFTCANTVPRLGLGE